VDGIGDVKNNGNADILIHYDDASGRHLLTLNEANYTTQSIDTVATVGKEWQIDGMGDFNGDGYADILMHYDNATSHVLGVLTNQKGSGWTFKEIGTLGKDVTIDGIGNFHGDGTADIAAHYDTATTRTDLYLEIHNTTVTAIHTSGVLGHEWIIG
jgi:hypothetical protein